MKLESIRQVEVTVKNASEPGFAFVKEFLLEFGYAEQLDTDSDVLDEPTSQALRKYQTFFRLPRSGDFDTATKETVLTPRCKLEDGRAIERGVTLEKCVTSVGRWNKRINELRYRLDKFPSVNPDAAKAREMVLAALKNSFDHWVDQARGLLPLSFKEGGEGQSVNIGISWIDSNDRVNVTLGDGKVAVADFPPRSPRGDVKIYFDNKLSWSIEPVDGRFHVMRVAMHEIGHTVGLDHCGQESSIMNPNLAEGSGNLDLSDEDRRALGELYGIRP